MSENQWSAVDNYIAGHLLEPDATLDGALARSREAGLPEIAVAPVQGKFLHLLARMIGARRILEIGTLGGYSTIWFARAVPADGKVITLEINPHNADVARKNLEAAGEGGKVEVRVGRAIDSLAALKAAGGDPFDLVFLDADKESNPDYLKAVMGLVRVGSVIVCDNVVRDGRVIDAGSEDSMIQGTRRLFETLAADKRLSATAIQTVGLKQWDGFAIAYVQSL